ncbi:hypothetical protein [Pedobacter kyungheensis]|uniref:hypothetical protein n=1 Tax=Pedobacter kyungheensis TaxID=1069985 RepID=UPI0006901E96|nr:hypothetical protein [Pedobacter kyungheensis]
MRKLTYRWISRLILLFLILGVYFPILNNNFSGRDDGWMLYNNAQVYTLDFTNVIWIFSNAYGGQFSPLNTLYYNLVYAFCGLNPFWFYLIGIFIHILNSCLLLLLLERILVRAHVTENLKGISELNLKYIAFFTALIFAIHPMQIEAVAWISASKILLFSFFFLAGLNFYLQYIESSKTVSLIFCFICSLLAFLSKEQSVVFPIFLIMIDYFLGRNILKRKIFTEKIPFFISSLLFGLLSIHIQNIGFHKMLEHHYYPFSQRVILACYSFNEYINKLLAPIALHKFYPFPYKVGESMPVKYWFYPVLLIFLIYYIWYWYKHKYKFVLFGLGFFFFNLILTLHIIPLGRTSIIADRYVYLSTAGFFFVPAVLIAKYYRNFSSKQKLVVKVLICAYHLLLIAYTVRRTIDWV